MQIRKAYLFGRTLKPGGTPPMSPEIYFENGRFNPIHIPEGFDFNNNRQVVVVNSDYNDFMNACTIAFENGEYASHYNDGTTFLIKTDNSDDETLLFDPVSGNIVFEYPTKRAAPSEETRVLYNSIVIPAVGFDANIDCVYVRLKTTSTAEPYGYMNVYSMMKVSATSVYGDDFFTWGYSFSYNQWGEMYCMTGYTDSKMDYLQIWFYALLDASYYPPGDEPFRVEIDKIWVTYTEE